MRPRTAALLAATVPLLGGCRVFEEPAAAGTAYATTLVSPSQYGDAQLLSCGPGATAKLTVTNPGPSPAAYTITVTYRSSIGTVLTRGVLKVGTLKAGQSATAAVPGAKIDGIAACSIESAQRAAA